jgi:Calcineurin-like phosphoesterase/Domain of unknown function DUF11
MRMRQNISMFLVLCAGSTIGTAGALAQSEPVTVQPYIQPGDFSTFDRADGIVVSWQTDETTPNPNAYRVSFGTNTRYERSVKPAGRVIDNYLSADPSLPLGGTPFGAHVAYTAVLKDLSYNTTYYYRVTGPGMPSGGFTASFHARKTGNSFSFAVEGDEGFFPSIANSQMVDYEARVVHEIYDAQNLSLPNQPSRPPVDFVVVAGDNVYNFGAQDSYRDFWFPVWNNDVDSNETGAPLARSIQTYIVAGNHDTGGNGDTVNLLSYGVTPPFSGGLGGGDALDYFNDYYLPENGPVGFDSQWIWNGDSAAQTGWYFSYNGTTYTSPAAIQALRDSTKVDTGRGPEEQMAQTANYSFDYGNAHFLVLDANPHLFDALVDYTGTSSYPPAAFPDYPSALRAWIINDLDSSRQLWKIAVFHQPAFSSGNGTLRNFQMRAIAKALEDHGVSVVFSGHEHNYQRTWPIRVSDHVATAPNKSYGSPAVAIDTNFDGINNEVPDGVIYLVEGAGGNRDFDGDYANPRGNGVGLDEDDSAKGTFTIAPGFSPAQGPASWLDTDLTNDEMTPFFPTAGSGPKITMKFKAKIFSFADVVVKGNSLTLYQISEPLQNTSSATSTNPYPYGTDFYGNALNDPIPDTVLSAANGELISNPATGTPDLLDKFTVTKPDVSQSVSVKLSAPQSVAPEGEVIYSIQVQNNGDIPLNGTQVRLRIPRDLQLAQQLSNTLTLHGDEVIYTLGRLAAGAQQEVQIATQVAQGHSQQDQDTLTARAFLTSATALPVPSSVVRTRVVSNHHDNDHGDNGHH